MLHTKSFVSFKQLTEQIYVQEGGVLQKLLMQYLGKLSKVRVKDCFTEDLGERYFDDHMLPRMVPSFIKIDDPDETFSDRYYLPIPWSQNFAGSVISFSGDNFNNTILANTWLADHQNDVDQNTELPIYRSDYTMANYMSSRLWGLLVNSISKSQYEEWMVGENRAQYRVILDQERRSFVVADTRHDIMIFTASSEFTDEDEEREYSFDPDHILGFGERVFLGCTPVYISQSLRSKVYTKEVKGFISSKQAKPSGRILHYRYNMLDAIIGIGELFDADDMIDGVGIDDVIATYIYELDRYNRSDGRSLIAPMPWTEY